MIQSKQDYRLYLEQDKKALYREHPGSFKQKISSILFDDIWNYEKLLRKTEYYANCRGSNNNITKYLRYRLHKAQMKTGIEIYPNTFGAGLSISHLAPIIVNVNAHIGENSYSPFCGYSNLSWN